MSKFKVGDKVKSLNSGFTGVVSWVRSSEGGRLIGIDGSPCVYVAARFELVSELTPHVHQKIIIAWADGEQIQYFDRWHEKWVDVAPPTFQRHVKYRVKPGKSEKELKIEELEQQLRELRGDNNE